MGHALLFASDASHADHAAVFQKGARALAAFKAIRFSDTAAAAGASLAVAPSERAGDKRIGRSADDRIWIASLGTWLPLPAVKGRDLSWLIEQYLTHGAHELARHLQGFFSLLIVDRRTGKTHVITDRCGSLHMYWRRLGGGHAVCSSSAALALCDDSVLDPVAVHEFVATGIIYEERSLWRDIRKIPPATVLTIDNAGASHCSYWNFGEVAAESLDLEDAVEQTHHALVEVLKALPDTPRPMVSDLTGGYDSRMLLTGMLAANRPFHTTVSGGGEHPDVRVAARIAGQLKLDHHCINAAPELAVEVFDAALRMTDGEYDAFDYARILQVHRQLSATHDMSLNGSFGQLARGYWWELLWPKLASKEQALDAAMLARKRFAAVGYEKSIFAPAATLDLAEHMAGAVRRATAPLKGLPNTSQMDCAYFSLRMQRWQGRIASSTNQLWPAFSPIGFSQVLAPILAAKARGRFRSLLVRRYFQRHAPILADIPLEHGYPPMPATPFNIWRFSPLLSHYGGKVWSKVAVKLPMVSKMATGHGQSAAPADRPVVPRPETIALFRDTALADWLRSPLLADTGLFRPDELRALLAAHGVVGASRAEQWRRLVTLESLLRRMATLR